MHWNFHTAFLSKTKFIIDQKMYYEENYMTYIEDEGCCDPVLFRLRKKRHFIVITLLLILAVVSIVVGLHNGLTYKKYSDLALIVGIFFPSIILVFICVYLSFICGRESFRRSVLSRIHHLSGGNPPRDTQGAVQYPQTNCTSRNGIQVRYQPKSDIDSINSPVAARNEKPSRNKIVYTGDDLNDYREAKISRKHFKSFSNSDISSQMLRNDDIFSKKTEKCKVNFKTADDCEYSSRFQGHQDVNQRKIFKRSVSDTANKSRYARSREDKYVWNADSFDKPKRLLVKKNSLNDASVRSDCESSYDAIRKSSETLCLPKQYKNKEECDRTRRFKEYGDCGQRYKSSNPKSLPKKTCCTKSEIRVYSTSVLKPPNEYKQTLKFSSFQPDENDMKEVREMASCSSSGDEKSSSFSRYDDTLEMERRSKRRENFPSERDTYNLKRKTIYVPSTSNEKSVRSSKEYAHEYCKYSKKKNKMAQQPLSRNEKSFDDHKVINKYDFIEN